MTTDPTLSTCSKVLVKLLACTPNHAKLVLGCFSLGVHNVLRGFVETPGDRYKKVKIESLR